MKIFLKTEMGNLVNWEERSLFYGLVCASRSASTALDRRRSHHFGLAHDIELCHRDLADRDGHPHLSRVCVKKFFVLIFPLK